MSDPAVANDPRKQAVALAQAAEALHSAPSNLEALTALAALFDAIGQKDPSRRALSALCGLAREQGEVALAIGALKKLMRGSDPTAQQLLSTLVQAYALGSRRLDGGPRVKPPAPPSKPPIAPPASAATDLQSAIKKALDALAEAQRALALVERQPGKLTSVPLLSNLPPSSLEKLIRVMRLEERSSGEMVMDVGHEARSLYVVARGTLRVSRGPLELGQLRAGAFFGEIALLQGTRRTARVTCQGPAWLLEIPKEALEEAARATPALADTLATYARSRLLGNVMRTTEIFRRLSPSDREHLVPRFEARLIPAGAFLLTEGEESERLHVIVSGEVEVRRGGQDVARLSAGEVFGEISLVARKPATADVVTISPTVTLSLDRARFDDVAVRHPALLAEIYKLLIQREAENRATDHASPVPKDDDAEELVV